MAFASMPWLRIRPGRYVSIGVSRFTLLGDELQNRRCDKGFGDARGPDAH